MLLGAMVSLFTQDNLHLLYDKLKGYIPEESTRTEAQTAGKINALSQSGNYSYYEVSKNLFHRMRLKLIEH